jgi:hypothetical protein
MLKRVVAITTGLAVAVTGWMVAGTVGAGPVQAATPVLMGVHDDVSPAELKQRYPGVRATREFVSGVQGTSVDLRQKYDAVAKSSWAVGLVPFVSIKTDPAKTADGRYDARFRELAGWLADKPDSYFVWYHEPEDDMTGPTFAKAFKRVRDVMKAVDPDVKVGYSAMAYQWRSSSSRTQNPAPWRVAADFYGVDTYSGGTQPGTAILSEHTAHMRWYRELVQKTPGASARWGLTERGFKKTASDQQRARDIDRETAYLQGLTAPPSFYLYWNTPGTEGDPDLVNGPKAQAAVARMVAALG